MADTPVNMPPVIGPTPGRAAGPARPRPAENADVFAPTPNRPPPQPWKPPPELPPEWRIPAQAVPRTDLLVTEDDTPVDNLFSAKQQRLLVNALYAGWSGPGDGSSILADANVGVFSTMKDTPLVPDVFVSLDVQINPEWIADEHRSYFIWEFGKPPDVVVEIVSNRGGGEDTDKLVKYARIGVPRYVVFDPFDCLKAGKVRVFVLTGGQYAPHPGPVLPGLPLGVTLWRGVFEDWEQEWLRWTDASGRLLPTADEIATRERSRAERAEDRAERAEDRAERAEDRAERAEDRAAKLAARLRALGVDPDA